MNNWDSVIPLPPPKVERIPSALKALADQMLDIICFWSNITTNDSARRNNVAVFCRSFNEVVSWIE